MSDESQWSSSEYSAQAEERFAEYLRKERNEAAPDFEAFCAETPELEDELFGLRTDWENVGGVVARIGLPATLPAESPSVAPSTQSAPAEAKGVSTSTLALAALALGLGTFGLLEWRGGRTLAAEREQLAELQRETAALADRAVRQSEELGGANRELEERAAQSEREREDAEARARAAQEEAERLAARVELADLAATSAELPYAGADALRLMERQLVRGMLLSQRLADESDLAELARVRRELEGLRTALLERRIETARHGETWKAIAVELGLDGLPPQTDMVPLGRDPRSGLHEFVHLATGGLPERDESGMLALRPEHGLVLFLIPGDDLAAFFLAREPLSLPQTSALTEELERSGLRLAAESELSAGARAIEGFALGPRAARSIEE